MFTALPLTKPSAPSALAPSNVLLVGIPTAGSAPNAANEFARALDRAQDQKRLANVQPPAPSARGPGAPASTVKPATYERPVRQSPPPPAQQSVTPPARPQQHNGASKSAHDATRDTLRDTQTRHPTRPPTRPQTDASADTSAQATRRTARARSVADDSANESANSAAGVAAGVAARSPERATPALQGLGAGVGLDKTPAGSASQGDGAAVVGMGDTGPGDKSHGNTGATTRVGGANAPPPGLGLHFAECPEHAPALNPPGQADPAGRRTNAQIDQTVLGGLGGHKSRGDIGSAVDTKPGSSIDAETIADADPSLARNTKIKTGDIDGDVFSDPPGGVVLDLRITGPVCEYRLAPHLVDSLGEAATAPAAAPAAAVAAALATNAGATTSDKAASLAAASTTPSATNPAATLTATPAGGWRFVQPPREPNATDADHPAALAALGSAIGAMNGLTPEVRSRQGFSPFDLAFTTPGASSATSTSLAELLGRAETASSSLPADIPTATRGTGAQAVLATTTADWQRSTQVHGTGQRQDSGPNDTSARALGSTEALLSAPAGQPGTLGEPGATGLPNFAASLATQLSSSLSAVDSSVNARPASAEFAAEVSQKIMLLVLDGVQTAKLHLNPAEMGPVTVQIQLDGASAQVHLAAENGDTRQALQDSMPQLASQLRESGLTLTGGGVFEQPRQTPQEPPPDQRAAQPDVKGSTRDGAGDTNPAQNLRAGGPGGTVARRGLVDLVA